MVKSIADFDKLGVVHGDLTLKKSIAEFIESGVSQSMIDEQRVQYAKQRAQERVVSPLLIAFEDKDRETFVRLVAESEDVNASLTVRESVVSSSPLFALFGALLIESFLSHTTARGAESVAFSD